MAQIKNNLQYGTTGTVQTANIHADAINDTKIADDIIGTEHFTAGEVDQTAIANQAINEAKMQISNSPTNGQFLSAQSSNTGGLTWAAAGGGKINQVLQTYKTNAFSTTSTSYTGISGFNRAISPSATSSKILVNLVFSWGMAGSNTSWFQLARTIGGGSEVIIAENSEDGSENAIFGSGIWGTNGNYGLRSIALDFLDTTNTTSEVFYYMKMRADGGTTYLNRIGANTSRAGTSQITCMEVLA